MFRARAYLQRISERIGPPSELSTVVAFGIIASLLSISAESKGESIPEQTTPKFTKTELINRFQFLAPYATLLLNHADCESLIPDLLRKRGTISHMNAIMDKRSLEEVYQVEWDNPLGEGGFGAVYLAVDRETGENVALKKISKEYTDDEGFQREMEALLAIQKAGGHPNVLQFRENFDDGHHFFLTMDYISGGEMFDHLINSGSYSEVDAARLIREVASALSFLHGIGIVHGDLKPENLMLSTPSRYNSVVKIIDFGTAQVSSENGDQAFSNEGVGTTPSYCPPELFKLNRAASKRHPSMDCWALGVILYIMLVGVHPFDLTGDASDEMIMNRIMNKEAPPLWGSPYTKHLSKSAIDLLEKILCWNEDERITADEVLKHPWVRGVTAKRSRIKGSDNKLSRIRKLRSRLEAAVFKDFISWSDECGQETKGSRKMSLMERSFRKFDEKLDGEETISLTAFSNLLSEHMQNIFYKKGEVVYKEGDKGVDMLFLNSGVVEVTTRDGFRTTLKAGDFVGEGALLSNKKRSGTVTCITPVHAIKITKKYFSRYLLKSDSELNLKILETSTNRDTSRKIFNGFSNLLTESMKNKSFKPGDIIYREGEKGNDMFFIKSGVVSVTDKDDFRATLKQGDFVGEGALLSNKPRSNTVSCLTQVEGMMISRDYFEKYLASSDKDLRLKMHHEKESRDLSRIRTTLSKQKYLRPLKFSKGDILFKEGDVTKNLYIVIDGEVDLQIGNLSAYRTKAGDIFGEHSLVFGSPRDSSAKCVTKKCKVVEIGPRSFRSLLETSSSSSSSLKDSFYEFCSRREFQKAVAFSTKRDFPKTEEDLLHVFEAIQHEKAGQKIVLEDVSRLLRNIDPNIAEKKINKIFQAIDLGGDGYISFETFKILFSYS